MPSTLSQRLRAARNYADLRQQDIADACALAGYGRRETDFPLQLIKKYFVQGVASLR